VIQTFPTTPRHKVTERRFQALKYDKRKGREKECFDLCRALWVRRCALFFLKGKVCIGTLSFTIPPEKLTSTLSA